MKKDIIVIGSGYGGLSTAALLAQQGHNVTVLEKNNGFGGRAMIFKQKGFTFDMGPSWYLMPEAFDHFFQQFGKNVSDYITLKPLDPMYRMFFGPKEYIDIVRDLKKNLKTFETIEKGSSKKIQEYLDIAQQQYELSLKYFLYKHYDSLLDFIDPKLMRLGGKINVTQTLEKHMSNYTDSDRLKKILGYTMVFLGGSPNNTPALYSLMSHADFNLGVYYPMGGFGALTDAFVQLCKEQGVTLKKNHDVKKINIKNGHAHSVKTNKGTFEADIIISNADYPFTETRLLAKQYQTHPASYWEKKDLAPSAYIIHLGIKGKVKNLQHHNLILSYDWMKHFNEIFDNPSWPDEPSYYVSNPTKTDSTIAPKGHELLFVLVPVAPGLRDSDTVREKYYKKIIEDLEKHTGQSIEDRIVTKRIFSQRDFISTFNAYKGTALGLAHTLMQTAIFRPKNKSKKVSNLYFVGQYTQPGIGVPIALISAELTAQRIQKDYGRS